MTVIEAALEATEFLATSPDYRGKDRKAFIDVLARQTEAEEKLFQALLDRKQERQDMVVRIFGTIKQASTNTPSLKGSTEQIAMPWSEAEAARSKKGPGGRGPSGKRGKSTPKGTS